jgi:plasmid segregation protein ParM
MSTIVIAIDHGNKQIKTSCGKIFVSGFLESDNIPPFGNDIIQYKGKYYSLSEQRIPYLRDKSTDERFFILSLFAFAYEIDAAGIYADNDVIGLKVITGLPPAHFGTQYEKFEQYFLKRNDIIEFEFKQRPYYVYIEDVMCFPQAYAAAMPVIGQLKDYPQATVVDLGGFTAFLMKRLHDIKIFQKVSPL